MKYSEFLVFCVQPNFSLLTENSRAEHAYIIQLLVLFPSTDYFCLIIVCSLLLFTCSHISNLIMNLHKNDIISTFDFYLFIHCFIHPFIFHSCTANHSSQLISRHTSPTGYLQNGGHGDHDENERGRFDTRAEGGQDLQ